jgi:hybrid polyketide synthase/nonribosomal peptide synthetase ACE1
MKYPEWPIWFHRASIIIWINAPQFDLVYNTKHYSCILNAVLLAREKAQCTLGSVSLATVIQCVLLVVNDLLQGNMVRFLHHLGGIELPIGDFRSWIVKEERPTTTEFREVPFDQWITHAEVKGLAPLLAAFLQMFATSGDLRFPKPIKD